MLMKHEICMVPIHIPHIILIKISWTCNDLEEQGQALKDVPIEFKIYRCKLWPCYSRWSTCNHTVLFKKIKNKKLHAITPIEMRCYIYVRTWFGTDYILRRTEDKMLHKIAFLSFFIHACLVRSPWHADDDVTLLVLFFQIGNASFTGKKLQNETYEKYGQKEGGREKLYPTLMHHVRHACIPSFIVWSRRL